MKLPRRKFLHLAAGAAALPAVSRMAWAQAYPSRPITMVVPFAAGGPVDAVARIIAEPMRAALGQVVIVENVGGAAGSIATGRVARAASDGYTLIIGNWGTHVVNGALYNLSYDLLTDFDPVSLLVSSSPLVIARKTMPATDLKDLIAWLKANPDRATMGTAGVGSSSHVFGILFQNTAGIRLQFVPYRGGGPAMQDLVAGQTDIMIDNPATSLPQVRAGTVRVYAVTSHDRLQSEPSIPTAAEAGLPGFHASMWYGIWMPKRVPRAITAKVNEAVVSALADPAVRKKLADQGNEVFPREQQTPDALAAYQRAETEKWWPIIKAANIKGE